MTTLARLLASVAVAAAITLPRPTPAGAATDPVGQWPLQPAPEVVARLRPARSRPGGRATGASTWPGSPGSRSARRCRAGSPSPAPSPARPVVTVDHGGTRTTYEPVATTLPRGTPVAAGAAIGSLGVVGSHCFPRACLHWGWIRGETYLDPLRLVGGGPVRLLPLAGLPSDDGGAVPALALPRTSPYAGWTPPAAAVRLWP